MRNPIRILPDDLASQIAAGEVVERPASVVKELIENSLDADARRIDVSILGGGIELIEIADDGVGMTPEQAPLCLGRHATSKLSAFTDLDALESYGFRGEALPSVASVSRLQIRTRGQESDDGVQLSCEGSTQAESAPAGHPVGTTITVQDLFYNVPARRKFLKSTNTESGHVGDVLIGAALSRPDVSFSLSREGRKVKSFPRVRSKKARVEQVLPEEDLIAFKQEKGPLLVEGFLSRPERSRQGALGLKILVNGRPVRDRALASTVAHAYGPSLERGRYPRGVVYLTLPPDLLDVNVHPQKTEVRFADMRAVGDALYSVVSRSVSKSLGQAAPSRAERSGYSAAGRVQPAARVMKSGPAPISGQRYEQEPGTGRLLGANAATPVTASQGRARGSNANLFAEPSSKGGSSKGPSSQPPSSKTLAARPKKTWKSLRFLSQVRGAFLVCEGSDALYVLDQHAADERVLWTRLKEGFESKGVSSQAMLFPTVVELPPLDCEFLGESEELKRLGFDVRRRSDNSVSVHALPKLLHRVKVEGLFATLVKDLRGNGVPAALRSLACLGAVRSGERLSREESEQLLRSLSVADFDGPCRHSSCVVSTTPFSELARKAGHDA